MASVALFLFPGVAKSSGPVKNADTVTPAQADFFETRVRPILAANCFLCHGPSKQMGGLRLDSREFILKGGGRGAAIAPKDTSSSLLLQSISGKRSSLKMPPGGRLKAEQVAALAEWVRIGAPWPVGKATDEAGKSKLDSGTLWSVRPIVRPKPPRVTNPLWVRGPIDSFILAKLDSNGMTPAPPAGRRELMRRVYFDLIGLPPTPEEVSAYLADSSPTAYEKLVDRLLASPRYGERWARYWLDLVRYADSNGYERDAEKPYSWKYRDYVIQSFNEDKPFDRFATEQLAGDELPDRNESTVAATGFLRLGTWDDEPNDPAQYKYERLDDLVHSTASAFIGLTVRCARCHDHKFDPIPQRDYYAFAGAFWGGYLDPGDGKLLGGPPPAKLGFQVLGFTDQGRDAPPLRLLKAGDARHPQDEVQPGFPSLVTTLKHSVQPPPPNAATTLRRTQLAEWITDPKNPLTARVIANRLWKHHFGQGIVRTPNNFGSKGAPPTHPELLDWLAAELLDAGTPRRGDTASKRGASDVAVSPRPPVSASPAWSLKRLHRLILLSNTYRMSSVHPKQAAYERKDFGNEFWWRFNRQRLDADALRDSVLGVSGLLNLKMGGPGFMATVNKEALEGLSRKGAEWSPSPPEEQRRRSVYMFLKRSMLLPLMTAFDFGDTMEPLEQRDISIVAPQALALMNNPWIYEQCDAFAKRVEAEAGTDPVKQIDRAWRLAFSRPPTLSESKRALSHLNRTSGGKPDDIHSSLKSLCHVLLNANEFIYVD